MLLNILQYLGQPPTAKTYPAPNVNSAEVEKFWCRDQRGTKAYKDSFPPKALGPGGA